MPRRNPLAISEETTRYGEERRRPFPKEREVYFIQAVKLRLIKIGHTDCAYSRLPHLQTGSPDELVLLGGILTDGAIALEAELHRRFAPLHERGEWFRPGDDLLAFIADVAARPDPWVETLRYGYTVQARARPVGHEPPRTKAAPATIASVKRMVRIREAEKPNPTIYPTGRGGSLIRYKVERNIPLTAKERAVVEEWRSKHPEQAWALP